MEPNTSSSSSSLSSSEKTTTTMSTTPLPPSSSSSSLVMKKEKENEKEIDKNKEYLCPFCDQRFNYFHGFHVLNCLIQCNDIQQMVLPVFRGDGIAGQPTPSDWECGGGTVEVVIKKSFAKVIRDMYGIVVQNIPLPHLPMSPHVPPPPPPHMNPYYPHYMVNYPPPQPLMVNPQHQMMRQVQPPPPPTHMQHQQLTAQLTAQHLHQQTQQQHHQQAPQSPSSSTSSLPPTPTLSSSTSIPNQHSTTEQSNNHNVNNHNQNSSCSSSSSPSPMNSSTSSINTVDGMIQEAISKGVYMVIGPNGQPTQGHLNLSHQSLPATTNEGGKKTKEKKEKKERKEYKKSKKEIGVEVGAGGSGSGGNGEKESVKSERRTKCSFNHVSTNDGEPFCRTYTGTFEMNLVLYYKTVSFLLCRGVSHLKRVKEFLDVHIAKNIVQDINTLIGNDDKNNQQDNNNNNNNQTESTTTTNEKDKEKEKEKEDTHGYVEDAIVECAECSGKCKTTYRIGTNSIYHSATYLYFCSIPHLAKYGELATKHIFTVLGLELTKQFTPHHNNQSPHPSPSMQGTSTSTSPMITSSSSSSSSSSSVPFSPSLHSSNGSIIQMSPTSQQQHHHHFFNPTQHVENSQSLSPNQQQQQQQQQQSPLPFSLNNQHIYNGNNQNSANTPIKKRKEFN